MAFQLKPNTGSIFKNKDRTEENKKPHATGQALIDGKEYWVSAYTNLDKNGNKWQSLSFKAKT